MKISEWNEDTPEKAGSVAAAEALHCDDSSVGEGGVCASEYHG